MIAVGELVRQGQDLAVVEQLIAQYGGDEFMGECSVQAYFLLADGRNLRFGLTDDDVAAHQGLWVDIR